MSLEILVVEKRLNDYILNISIQQIRSNNLASYSTYTKKITIYTEMINQMVKDIEKNILNINVFEATLYKNLSILQTLLHEVEHANQQKIAYNDNTLEALIIRLSYLVNNGYNENLYEYCPEERLAEIKTFDEIFILVNHIKGIIFSSTMRNIISSLKFSSPTQNLINLTKSDHIILKWKWH